MPAVGMLDAQVLRHMIKFEDWSRGGDHRVHAAPFEIGVAERSVDEDVSRRQRADEFGKIEGNLGAFLMCRERKQSHSDQARWARTLVSAVHTSLKAKLRRLPSPRRSRLH